MKMITARFIGGPFDGKVLEVAEHLDTVEVATEAPIPIRQTGGIQRVMYRRHLLTRPVGDEKASAIFALADMAATEVNRLIRETLSPRL